MIQRFEATLQVRITHQGGPELEQPHVLAWLAARGPATEVQPDADVMVMGPHAMFWVCPTHRDPGDCDETVHDTAVQDPAVYEVKIVEVAGR